MINKAILLGRIGSSPQKIKRDTQLATFVLATHKEWTNRKLGKPNKKTVWHKIIVAKKKLIRVCMHHLNVGDLVYIEGEIETQVYKDVQNNKIFANEIEADTIKKIHKNTKNLIEDEGLTKP